MTNRPEDLDRQAGQKLKERIVKDAIDGKFNHSPLLSTPHTATCETCGRIFKITYLEYLKNGQFKIAGPQVVETESLLGSFMAIEEEKVTSIIMEVTCEQCGSGIELKPLTVEYLMLIANRAGPSRTMYS